MCSYHGWRFDGEGKCTDIPQSLDAKANASACANPRSCAISHPTQVCRNCSSPVHRLLHSRFLCPGFTCWHFGPFHRGMHNSESFHPHGPSQGVLAGLQGKAICLTSYTQCCPTGVQNGERMTACGASSLKAKRLQVLQDKVWVYGEGGPRAFIDSAAVKPALLEDLEDTYPPRCLHLPAHAHLQQANNS